MQEELLNAYKEQLPKYQKLNWLNIFLIFITIISFVIALIQFHYSPKNPPEYIYSIFLILLIVFLIIYTYIRESRRYHRYSESILHIYYAQERIKEYLTSLNENHQNNPEDLKKIYTDIINVLSNCFSLLTSKTCHVSVKNINSDGKITTFVRDSNSNTRYHSHETDENKILHYLNDNTDFEFIKNQYKRYFISNNLKKSWKYKQYKNSSFKIVEEPKIKEYFGLSKIINWNLPYISTLVVPIRYITSNRNYYYYGFLCIDTNSRNIFNKKIDPELAIVFADMLCTLTSQTMLITRKITLEKEMEEILDECTKPTKTRR